MDIKKIFSLKVANHLIKMGNEIIDYEINLQNPKFKIFIFKKTDKLINDLTEFTKLNREQ